MDKWEEQKVRQGPIQTKFIGAFKTHGIFCIHQKSDGTLRPFSTLACVPVDILS